MEKLDCSGEYNPGTLDYRITIELPKEANGEEGDRNLCPTVLIPLFGKCKTFSFWPFKKNIHFIIIVVSRKDKPKSPENIISKPKPCNDLIPYEIINTDDSNHQLIIKGSLGYHGLFPDMAKLGVVIIEETNNNDIFTKQAFRNEFKEYKKKFIADPNKYKSYLDKEHLHNFLHELIKRLKENMTVEPPQAVGNGGILKPA
jgi:hypothetical protein